MMGRLTGVFPNKGLVYPKTTEKAAVPDAGRDREATETRWAHRGGEAENFGTACS